MLKSLKKEWLKALRSGKYRKTTGRLRRGTNRQDYSYCCLGVLCNIINNRKWKDNSYMSDLYGLPGKIVEKCSISMEQEIHLSHLNDSTDTFAEVIDYINKNM
jgi:hypothetical protein